MIFVIIGYVTCISKRTANICRQIVALPAAGRQAIFTSSCLSGSTSVNRSLEGRMREGRGARVATLARSSSSSGALGASVGGLSSGSGSKSSPQAMGRRDGRASRSKFLVLFLCNKERRPQPCHVGRQKEAGPRMKWMSSSYCACVSNAYSVTSIYINDIIIGSIPLRCGQNHWKSTLTRHRNGYRHEASRSCSNPRNFSPASMACVLGAFELGDGP